jgi:mRNA interferase MazF
MHLQPGDVVLVRIGFHQAAGGKVRPAVVLLDTGDDDFIAAPVTSQSRFSDYDVLIRDWKTAGLNVPSFVRVHKMTVLAKNEIGRQLGKLAREDRDSILAALRNAFSG